jgi:hypothetical protein
VVSLARRTRYSIFTEIICNRTDKYTVLECWDAIRLLERGESSSKPYRLIQFKKPDGSMCQITEENRNVVNNQLDAMFNKESTFDQSMNKHGIYFILAWWISLDREFLMLFVTNWWFGSRFDTNGHTSFWNFQLLCFHQFINLSLNTSPSHLIHSLLRANLCS